MTVLVSDSFNRADSTTTLGTTDSFNGGTAKAWSVEFPGSRTCGISSNQAYQVTTNSDARAYVDAAVSDCIVKAIISVYSIGIGLVFRYSSDTDYMEVVTTATAYVVRRFNLDEGTVNMISYTATPASGDTVAVKLNGSSIELQLNNVTVGTTTSTRNITYTKHGMRFNGNAGRINDLQITDLAVGGTDATITAIAATATSSAIAPIVTSQQNVTVTSVIASSIADGIAPTVSAQKQVAITSITANSNATALAPTVGSSALVSAIVASAASAGIVPLVTVIRNIEIIGTIASALAVAGVPRIPKIGWNQIAAASTTWRPMADTSTTWRESTVTPTIWR